MDISQWADQFKAHIDEGGIYTQEIVLEMINELQAQNERYRVALEKIIYLYDKDSVAVELAQAALKDKE